MNKKGILPLAGVLAIIIGLVLVIALFATSAFAELSVDSLTPKADGYSKTICPDLGVNMRGKVNVVDSAVFDLEPSLNEISVNEVKVNGRNILAFGEEPFTYTVEAFTTNNQKVGTEFKGSGILRSSDNQGINKDWAISFIVPDHDCNGKIDDFDLRIVAQLQGADIGDVAEQSTLISFRNGGVQ